MPNVHRPLSNRYNWKTGELHYRYHGNYCGPGWSAGKYQRSTLSSVKPVDAFDRSCMLHDRAYALHGNNPDSDYLWQADLAFYRANINGNKWQRAAALAVYYGNGPRVHKKNRKSMVYGTGDNHREVKYGPVDKRGRGDEDPLDKAERKRLRKEKSNENKNFPPTPTKEQQNVGQKSKTKEISVYQKNQQMSGGIAKLGTLVRGYRKVGPEPTTTDEVVFKKELVLENSANTAAKGCVGFTVATLDSTVVPLAMAYEIVRKLFAENGLKINDFNEVNVLTNSTIISGNVGFINLIYKANASASGTTTVSTAITFADTYLTIVNNVVTLINSGTDTALFEYFELAINVPSGYPFRMYRLYTDRMKFTYSSFSWMEIQNLTNDGTATTTDIDVNAMPLVFKSFEGIGRGPLVNTGQIASRTPVYIPSANLTLTQFDDLAGGANDNALLKEIPNNHFFQNVKLVATGGLEYGDMKKFIIKHHFTFPVRTMNSWYYDLRSDGYQVTGKSRFLSVFMANPISYAARSGALRYAGKIVSTYKGHIHGSTKMTMATIAPVVV